MSDMTATGGRGARAPLDTSTPQLGASEVRDWFTLLKPRVLTLVVFTGIIGLAVAPGHLHPILAATAILAITVAAGAAGAINMWYDRDIDAVMRRTQNRPIPSGRIGADAALAYGIMLSIGSVMLMGLATNWLAAVVLASSIGFYVFIYTMWLKRRTPQNIVIGGAAGAFPPLIGWVAVTGQIDAVPLVLFAMIFMWTPPHFWALALWAHQDYQRAGVPMLPVIAGARETRRQVVIYTILLVPLTLLPWWLGFNTAAYGLVATLLGANFLRHAWLVWRDEQDASGVSLTGDAPAKKCFKYSVFYLFLLFGALAADRLLLA